MADPYTPPPGGGTEGGVVSNESVRQQIAAAIAARTGRPATEEEITQILQAVGVASDPWISQAYLTMALGLADHVQAGGGVGDPLPTDTTTGAPSGGGVSGGTDLSGLLAPYGKTFAPPDQGAAWADAVGHLGPLPEFTAPDVPQIDPYGSFAPPTAQDVYSDPSFGLRKDLGEQALLNSAAAKGLARSGGTLKDLLAYNQNFASQEFNNMWGRRMGEYDTNRTTWQGNAQTQLGAYDRDLAGRRAEYEPQILRYTTEAQVGQRGAETAYDQAYRTFMTDYDAWLNQRNTALDQWRWEQGFNRDSATL